MARTVLNSTIFRLNSWRELWRVGVAAGLVPALFLVGSISGAGCVDKEQSTQKKVIDPAYIEAHILSAAPALQNVVNADFGGKVIYLGNNVSTKTLAPGGKVTIDHYWKVVTPPGGEWRIFAHVTGTDRRDWMNVDYTDMRVGYPAEQWRPGVIIHDEQKFALAKDWRSTRANVLVGLYPRGKHAISDRMQPAGGVVDKERRVLAVSFSVEGTDSKTPGAGHAPRVDVIRRATGPIKIDGVADEPSWKTAPESPDFTIAEGGPKHDRTTNAKLLWDDTNLYVFAHLEDTDVASQYKANDDPMWKEDILELFIDADGSGDGYVELQVNPNNAQFDAWFPKTRRQKSKLDWSAGMTSAVKVYGTLNKRGDQDQAWDVEIAIPLIAVKGADATMKVAIPPKVGDKWRLNLVRGEKPKKGSLIASSWNPITYNDFHALDKMLSVTFGDAAGGVKAAPASVPAVSPEGAPGSPASASQKGAAVLKKTKDNRSKNGTAAVKATARQHLKAAGAADTHKADKAAGGK